MARVPQVARALGAGVLYAGGVVLTCYLVLQAVALYQLIELTLTLTERLNHGRP